MPVATIAGALFCVVLIFLALQVRAGEDPALGPVEPSAAEGTRPVVVRRMIVRRVVEQPAVSAPSSGGQGSFASATSAPSVAAPAPAPAPAPVVSSGS